MENKIHISLSAEKLFQVNGFTITNTLLVSLIVFLILSVSAYFFRKKLSLIPGFFQNLVEYLISGALNLMKNVLGSEKKAEKYLPLIFTIFIFILISNWLGLLPGVGSIVLKEHNETIPIFRSPSSDLNFTLALAIISVVAVNLLGITVLGFFKYFKKFINFSNPVQFFIGILELISEIAKMISFSFRLFGNVFAGEVLLTIVGFLAPYFIPLPFLFLEIFVGFIQAFVFAMLSLVFVSIATSENH
ncbi:MAG: F0F1 ATP synthase subunit A [Minisyncoccia bacterium]